MVMDIVQFRLRSRLGNCNSNRDIKTTGMFTEAVIINIPYLLLGLGGNIVLEASSTASSSPFSSNLLLFVFFSFAFLD
jgi:hypothetical protein